MNDDDHADLARLTADLRAAVAWHARAGAFATSARPTAVPDDVPVVDDAPIPLGRRTLADIRDELGDCQRCKLAPTRNKIVFGNGAEDAVLMFVGEGPGADEDRLGDPFVGKAGELLDKMIDAMGWSRDRVYVANTVKCLRYTAMVLLEDGRWERIGRLVRQRYSGKVMSVDAEGRLVPRRVIGWHASPLAGRTVYRLSYASAKANGSTRVGIQLTGDHRVLTDRGYVAVEELPLDARIATGFGLSDVARDVVYGTLLGDGHLAAKSASLEFSHSRRQEDYALFKAELLAELQCSAARMEVAAGGEQRYPVTHVRTLAHRALRPIRAEFYRPQKRVPSHLANRLNARMLAIWFMDDGYLRVRQGRRPLAEIATCAFSKDDLEVLIEGLANLGLEAYARSNRLYFDVDETAKLSTLIAPYTPAAMRYKLCPDVAESVPFDPDRWLHGPAAVVYERAIAERIEHTGTDQTFFCIDVEETHNFVTAGGVVHNCRPPQNRTPEADELAACQPFLNAQIDAIRPRVIVALGKPAANTLLGTNAPISTLRGRFHDYRNGARLMPTFHPAYLLREPDKKRDTWNDLKLVIAELERLGISPPKPPRG